MITNKHICLLLIPVFLGGCTSPDSVHIMGKGIPLPLPGTFTYGVTSTPPGADIFLNGKFKGTTPLAWKETFILQSISTTEIKVKLTDYDDGLVSGGSLSTKPKKEINAKHIKWGATKKIAFDLPLSPDEAFRRAREENTDFEYRKFIQTYPDSKLVIKAKKEMVQLKERDWEKALQEDSSLAYSSFLKKYPSSKEGEELLKKQYAIAMTATTMEEAGIIYLQYYKWWTMEQKKGFYDFEKRIKERAIETEREAFVEKIPAKVDPQAYVHAYRQSDDPIMAIGIAGEFIIQRILNVFEQRPTPIEPRPEHPLIVEFVTEHSAKAESFSGTVGELPVSANLTSNADYNAEISDPATEAIRKSNPDAYIENIDPRLHIVSGGFSISGYFVVEKYSIMFIEGGVMTQSTSEEAFFISGTRALIGDGAYVFNGSLWSKVTER